MNDATNSVIDILRLVGAGVVGGLIGAFTTHRLTKIRERASGIMAEKLKFIPMIDNLFDATDTCQVPNMIRRGIRDFYEPAMRFRIRLKGKRLRNFNEAWQALYQTSAEDVKSDVIFKDGSAELKEVQNMLKCRLGNLRKVIESC